MKRAVWIFLTAGLLTGLLTIALVGCPENSPPPPPPPAMTAPTGVTATQNLYYDAVGLSWDPVTGAAEYNIYRASSATGTYDLIRNIPATYPITSNSTTDPASYPITKGIHYFYKVEAVNSAAVAGPLSSYAEGWSNTYMFNDSFEDGDYTDFPEWSLFGAGGSAWQITSPGADSTSYALSYYGGSLNGYNTSFASAGNPTYIGFWTAVSSTIADFAGCFVCVDSTAHAYWSIAFYFYGDGKMYVEDDDTGTYVTGPSYVEDTWYHVEMRNIDWTARTYDFYVDGVAYGVEVTMRDDTPANVSAIWLFNDDSAQAWWDEIVMY